MQYRLLLVASLLAATAFGEEGHEVDEEKEVAARAEGTQPYKRPNTEGLHWVETFDGDALTRFIASTKEKYNGQFTVDGRKKAGLVGDLALLVPEAAKHYGISSSFPALQGAKNVPFVLQMEVQFQERLQCGGSYVKVFDRKEAKAEDFDNDTPYIIMFGPDRCGGTDKVHFILQHQNPKTGKWEEKHLKEPPRVPDDDLTHLYTLIINPDNSFEVQVDGVKKASGDLLTSMDPPINPPKDIDDASDSKPGDWVDEAKMDDPASSKPGDWDEEEPYSIPDPAAKIPDGWNEDVAAGRIPDPSATIPADWDEEEDGEWEAPSVDNPACKVGCGKWVPPTIDNPKYKGKWSAPKIDNPEYKGVWAPRQIANPDFFEDKAPCILPTIDSVGIDIWTMQGGILFDNFIIDTDPKRAAAFAEESWRIRSSIEELQKPSTGIGQSIFDYVSTGGMGLTVAVVGVILAVLVLLWCFFCQGPATPPPRRPTPEAKKKKRDESPAATEEKDPADDQDDAKEKEGEEKKDD